MPDAPQKAKKTRKGRKHGRNKTRSGSGSMQNTRYKAEHRHEKSHIRRITKHLERYGERRRPQVDHPKRVRSLQANGDQVARQALANYKAKAGVLHRAST